MLDLLHEQYSIVQTVFLVQDPVTVLRVLYYGKLIIRPPGSKPARGTGPTSGGAGSVSVPLTRAEGPAGGGSGAKRRDGASKAFSAATLGARMLSCSKQIDLLKFLAFPILVHI